MTNGDAGPREHPVDQPDMAPIPYNVRFTSRELARLRHGLVPREVGDEWAIRFSDGSLFLQHRGTGRLLYQVDLFLADNGSARVVCAWCAADVLKTSRHGHQAALLACLINNLLLGRSTPSSPLGEAETQRAGDWPDRIAGTADSTVRATGRPPGGLPPPRAVRRLMRQAAGFLTSTLGFASGGPEQDGLGQTVLDDLRFVARFRRCSRMAVTWHVPSEAEARSDDEHGTIGRFGDETIAVAHVDGRRWIVRERDWHGWPDPPRYVFFAEEGKTIWAARDFNKWPRRWRLHADQQPERGAAGDQPAPTE
jgi:hypothetical protein